MNGALCYLDASALAKIVIEERESAALGALLRDWPLPSSSILADVELHRLARRHHGRVDPLAAVERVIATTTLLDLTPGIVSKARSLVPPELRTIDAIHLATALSLGDDLGVFVAYDRRLIAAAEQAGLPTASPGT